MAHPSPPSDSALAANVLELTKTLSKTTQELSERSAEKQRLTVIQGEFRKHISWQSQQAQTLRRNIERLHNEIKWLDGKTTEITNDTRLLSHEVRQRKDEVDQIVRERDAARSRLRVTEEELKLEQEAFASLQQICVQGSKALAQHTRQREARKAELEKAKQEAQRMQDRVEALTYQLNGMGTL